MKAFRRSLLAASATGLLALAAVLPARADYSNTVASFNPLGYWRLNETWPPPAETGTVYANNLGTGGSALNGVYTAYGTRGVTGALVGSTDTAVLLNGTSQDIDIPFDATLNTTVFSAEAWAYPTAANASAAVLSSGLPAAGSRQGWVLYQLNTQWSLRLFENSGANTVTGDANGINSALNTVTLNAWQHLVAVNDGTNCYLYVNGVLAAQTNSTTYSTAASGGTTIGKRYGSANWFKGVLDECAFYTNALSASDVWSHYTNGLSASPSPAYQTLVGNSSPVAYYRLDEAPYVGPAATNSGSLLTAADGTYSVGTTPGSAGPASEPGIIPTPNYACAFNGSAQINCGNNSGFNVNQISISAWFQAGTLAANMSILAKGSSSWSLQMDGATRHLKWVCPGGGVTGVKYVNDGQWHHVVAVAGSSGSTMYVDGVLDGSSATPVTSIPTTTAPVTIGSQNGAAFWNGSLDEVAIYGTALSQANALAIYNASLPPAFDGVVTTDTSTLAVAVPAVWADGVAAAILTATCFNAETQGVPGKTVTLTSDRGATDTITPASGTSDPNGQVAYSVTSSTVGYATFTATDTTDGLTVTQTVTVAFSPKPAPVTTYVTGCSILTNWDFTNYANPGWTTQRTAGLSLAGLQLGQVPVEPPAVDHGAWVGLMRVTPPATMPWVNSGVEMTYYAPNLPPPTDGYEFLMVWTDSPRTGYGVLSSGGGAGNTLRTSARTQQQSDGADSTWTVPTNPTLGTGLDGLHTMALVRNGDLSLDTYLDGVKVNTRSTVVIAGTSPQYISIGWNVNGNMYMPFGSIVESVRAFTVNPLVGAVDTNLSTVVASPPGAWADGIAFSTVTATLRDGTGTLVPGKTVTLVKTSGGGTPVITTVTGVTGGDGQATFKVASTTVATDVFTATDTTDGKVIYQTASVAFVASTYPMINVNFDTATQAGLVGPAGGLGATWNQQLVLAGLYAGNLVDANGIGTTVGITCNANGVGEWGTPTLSMLAGGAFNFGGGSFNLVITNLPAGTNYDVYLPSYCNVRSGTTVSYTTANTTPTLQPLVCDNGGVAGSDSADWIQGQNYVILRQVVPDASGNITITSTAGATGGDDQLCGFQLMAAVPLVAPPAPALVPGGFTIPYGYPTFTFTTVPGNYYRLISSTNVATPLNQWQGVVIYSPPGPSDVNGWLQATDTTMTLQDPTSTTGIPQLYYRIEATSSTP